MSIEYKTVQFDEKYNHEDQNKRFKRLLREFNSKFAVSLTGLHEAADDKARADDSINLEEIKKPLEAYEAQVIKIRENILLLEKNMSTSSLERKARQKEALVSDELFVEGYPTKKYLIELLARAATAIDAPDNDDNKIQLLTLANKIPEDTQGYWRHLKIGIILFITEAAMLGIILGGAGIIVMAPPAAALLLVLLAMLPAVGGAILMTSEMVDIEDTRSSQGIKKIVTSSKASFFPQEVTGSEETDDERLKHNASSEEESSSQEISNKPE